MSTTRQTRPRPAAAPRPMATEHLTEAEALRADLEMTRQHLADTVQELTRQLNVPRRIKESATDAGHRAVQAAGHAGQKAKVTAAGMGERAKHLQLPERMKTVPAHAKNLPAKAKQVPELGRRHPKATAAVGGAVALGIGATAWIVGRGR
jgi:cell division septation protein DedD